MKLIFYVLLLTGLIAVMAFKADKGTDSDDSRRRDSLLRTAKVYPSKISNNVYHDTVVKVTSSADNSSADGAPGIPDTVTVGIYVTSIHNVDFREKEFSMNLWLWLKYKRSEFDFMRNLEVPMAKSYEKYYASLDTLEDGTIYVLMKLECLMKGAWKINHFPFDRQKLRFSIENSMYDASELVFKPDTVGAHYGKYFLPEWEKDSFSITTGTKAYETGFGDPELDKPYSEYSAYRAVISVHRDSWQLFFKIFLGMYISFMISGFCFFLPVPSMDSRLALSVGALFAVIGNKYIIDSSLPESNSFTLVDMLHGFTLLFILIAIASSVYTVKLYKANRTDDARRLNRKACMTFIALYVLLNAYFIYRAISSPALA